MNVARYTYYIAFLLCISAAGAEIIDYRSDIPEKYRGKIISQVISNNGEISKDNVNLGFVSNNKIRVFDAVIEIDHVTVRKGEETIFYVMHLKNEEMDKQNTIYFSDFSLGGRAITLINHVKDTTVVIVY